MRFSHADPIWHDFPELVPAAIHACGIRADLDVRGPIEALCAIAKARLATGSEGEWPEIQAWRRAFARMGLKPTQVRCAAESLLRRLRKEGTLPALHPLVDLCNAVSVARAVPIAVLDVARVAGGVEVRRALGSENYQDFGGAVEHPDAGEVVFVDGAGHAHARRWCHRQSGRSAVGADTSEVLIVAESMHADAAASMRDLVDNLGGALRGLGVDVTRTKLLRRDDPVFEF